MADVTNRNIRFDRKIVIQETTETQDAYGELDDSWSTHATVWAHLEERKGKEDYTGGREVGFVPVVFLIRYLSTVTEKMRVSWNSKTYDIISIEEVGRNKYHRLACELRQ